MDREARLKRLLSASTGEKGFTKVMQLAEHTRLAYFKLGKFLSIHYPEALIEWGKEIEQEVYNKETNQLKIPEFKELEEYLK